MLISLLGENFIFPIWNNITLKLYYISYSAEDRAARGWQSGW